MREDGNMLETRYNCPCPVKGWRWIGHGERPNSIRRRNGVGAAGDNLPIRGRLSEIRLGNKIVLRARGSLHREGEGTISIIGNAHDSVSLAAGAQAQKTGSDKTAAGV